MTRQSRFPFFVASQSSLYLLLSAFLLSPSCNKSSTGKAKPSNKSKDHSSSDSAGKSNHSTDNKTEDAHNGDGKYHSSVACKLSSTQFATWFKDGSVSKDGFVSHADSLQPFEDDCDFYRWSWRMFLWNTSQTEGRYVFDSAPFFDMLPGGTLVSNTDASSSPHAVRGGKIEGTGQAGTVSGVLMTQAPKEGANGSLVYYAIHVNDAYAYMASGVNSGKLKNLSSFPTTLKEIQSIETYAKSNYQANLSDLTALTLELKSAWVEVSAVKDSSTYVITTADIPKYEHKNDQKWTWDGKTFEKDVKMAMIGYHLVGSVAGHPEMVWATFEHRKNAPDFDYFYKDASGKIQKQVNWKDGVVKQGDWLLMNTTTRQQATNQAHMDQDKNTIAALPEKTISPSSTSRTHPWGGPPVESSADNNTRIISLNTEIDKMLAKGDLRKNYILIGATWTSNGVVPGAGLKEGIVAGSEILANTTMETYFQFKDCFGCHRGGSLNGLSHIFGSIKPLKPK